MKKRKIIKCCVKSPANVEPTLMIDIEKIDFDDLETQYEIATGKLELFTDKRKYNEAIACKKGMARIGGNRIEQIIVDEPKGGWFDGSKGEKPMFKFDDGRKTADYQSRWTYEGEHYKDYYNRYTPLTRSQEKKVNDWTTRQEKIQTDSEAATKRGEIFVNPDPNDKYPVKRKRLYTKDQAERLAEDSRQYYNPDGGNVVLHKDLFKDVEIEIFQGLEMCKARKRTAAELNDLPEKYRTCPNMKIFIEYDIKDVPKLQQEACIVLMNFYNKFRKFEMELFKRNDKDEDPKLSAFDIMQSFGMARRFERIIALNFELYAERGIKVIEGASDGGNSRNKPFQEKRPSYQPFVNEYLSRNPGHSYSEAIRRAAFKFRVGERTINRHTCNPKPKK